MKADWVAAISREISWMGKNSLRMLLEDDMLAEWQETEESTGNCTAERKRDLPRNEVVGITRQNKRRTGNSIG